MEQSTLLKHSSAWVTFTYAAFAGAAGMVGLGILFIPAEIWIKAYLAMGVVMLVQTCVTLTKTLRDQQEAGRLHNRIEDAKTEQLLMRIDRAKD
ncbi:YiaA/YiaB family inner membrane protein [Labrys neptuniae]